MSAVAAALRSFRPDAGGGRGSIVRDTLIVTRRNLRYLLRQPQLAVFVTIQPIMLVLLFNFVFGGAIGQTLDTPGVSYIDFLLPGILVQAVAFGTTTTAVGTAEDLAKGIVDRFRSLPMARSAVLAGRALADTARIAFVVLLMTGVGVLLGFDIQTDPARALGAFGIVLLFGLSFSWISVVIGTVVSTPEAAQSAGFIWLFPLVFASSAFVPVETFDPWLREFAEVNPITHYIDAIRSLVLDVPTGSGLIPTSRPVLLSLGWTAAILATFAPLAVWRYRKVA